MKNASFCATTVTNQAKIERLNTMRVASTPQNVRALEPTFTS